MNALRSVVPSLSRALLQALGATFLTFALLGALSPDPVYDRLGKSATPDQIAQMRHSLGLDRAFLVRYGAWLGGLAQLDAGVSIASGEPVGDLVRRTLPVTLCAVLPGFVLGHFLALAGALVAVRRGGAIDRGLSALSGIGSSFSFVIVLIGVQALLCSPAGLSWLPTRGWQTGSAGGVLASLAAPTVAMTLVTSAWALRYDRALLLDQVHRPHAATARAYGAARWTVLLRHVLPGALAPIVSRALFGMPVMLLSGSLLLETQFGIPGLGQAACDAIAGNDTPVLLALAGLAAMAFSIVLAVAGALARRLDRRADLP